MYKSTEKTCKFLQKDNVIYGKYAVLYNIVIFFEKQLDKKVIIVYHKYVR